MQEKKKGRILRRTMKEAGQLQSYGKPDQNSHKALPTELLKVSSSLKKDISPLKSTKKSPKVTLKGKEIITKQLIKIKTQEDKLIEKELSHIKSSKDNVQKTMTEAQQKLTEVKVNARKNRKPKDNTIQEDVKDNFFKTNLIGTPKRENTKPSALNKTSSAIKASKGNKMTSITVQSESSASVEDAEKEEANIQSKPSDVKPVKGEVQPEKQRVKLTPKKDLQNVKSITDKGQSKTQNVKSPQVKKETTPVQDETSKSVRSTPVKVKRKLQHVKSTPVINQSKHDENAKSRKEGKVVGKELQFSKDTSQKLKNRLADKKKLPHIDADSIKIKEQKKSKKSKLKGKTKPGGEEEEEFRGNADSKGDIQAQVKSKKTEVSSLHLSQDNEAAWNPISPQSPKRTEVDSVGHTKSLQSSQSVERDVLVSERDRDNTQCLTGEIFTNATSLLPAVGLAGAAMEVLSEAVTSIQGLQSDSDSATSTSPKVSKQRQFMKQSAVMQPSLSSTLSHLSSTEASNAPAESTKKHVQVRVLSGSENGVQEKKSNHTSYEQQELVKSDLSELNEDEDISQAEGKKSDSDMETFQQEFEKEEDENGKTFKVSINNVGEEGEGKAEEEAGTEDDEEGESGSNVENEEEGSERDDKEEENGSVDDEEAQDNKTNEEESEDFRTSNSDEEGEGSEKSDTTEAEGKEEESEESSEETSESGSDSEVNEAAVEEEGSESESSSDESSNEEGDEAEVSEDEEDESDKESGSAAGSESEESEEEEEDRKGSDTAESESARSEEEDEEEESEIDENEEGETEEQEDEDSTESEDEEKDSEEDEETDENVGEDDEDKQDETTVEHEEEEEEDNETDKEEEGQDEESGKENEDEGESEEDAEEQENEEEEVTEEEIEEDQEEIAGEEEEGEEEDEEEESEKKDMEGNKKALVETGDEEGDEEEEEEEDSTEEESETIIKPKTETRLKNQREVRTQEQTEGKKAYNSEKDDDEGEEEESYEEEEEVSEEEEAEEEESEEKRTVSKVEGGSKLAEEEQESEEVREEEEEGEEENYEEEGEKEEEEEEGEGEEEDDEKDKEEEEEEVVKSIKLPSKAVPPNRKENQQKETPKPAPRTKQRAAGEKKQDESQQFWNNVLPQYLDLQ